MIISENKIPKNEIVCYLSKTCTHPKKHDTGIISKPLKLYNTFINNKVREIGFYTRGFNLIKTYFPYLLQITINDILPTYK